PQSVTKPVRAIYTLALSVLPISVSILLLYGVGNLLYTEPNQLVYRLAQLQAPTPDASHIYITSAQLQTVFASAKLWFGIVAALHIIPLYFIYINVVPTYRRWNYIHRKKESQTLHDFFVDSRDTPNTPRSFGLYDKQTNERLAPLSESQRQ